MSSPTSKDALMAAIAAARAKMALAQVVQASTGIPPEQQKDLSPQTLEAKLRAAQSVEEINAKAAAILAERQNVLPIAAAVSEILPAALPIPGAFQWNAEQQQAIDKALSGESFNFIGAAGTGKTTTLKEIVRRLVEAGSVPILDEDTKYLQRGLPGILLTSFTRRAVRNIRKVMSQDIQPHCVTVHKVLEFEPVFYEVLDEQTQRMKTTMRFEPMRGPRNTLPSTLMTIVVDESSMLSVELFMRLVAALPNGARVQFIFVGDLHQLPPVYGQAILGFKLIELPTVELTQIYRQAQESPIIALAHKIKNGEEIKTPKEIVVTETSQGKVTVRPWKKPLSDFDAMMVASTFLKTLVTSGTFNVEEDVVLCPQEKTTNRVFGTNEFNKVMAQALGEQRNAEVYEVIAGFNKHYLAPGDRVLVDREDAEILTIRRNMKYFGKRPQQHSTELDRWGNYKKKVETTEDDDFSDVDDYLNNFTLDADEKEDRKQECSHVITVKLLDSEKEVTLSAAGEINAMMFAYCLTVHKAQGSEWKRVFFLTHQSHVTQWSRELLYTAVTRAREELYLVVEPDRPMAKGTLWKAAISPRIKGETLAEKAEFFKGKQEDFKKKEAEILALQTGTAKAIKKPEEEKPVRIAPQPEKPPVKLLRLEELIPASFKAAVHDSVRAHWNRARTIWQDKIGSFPTTSFDLYTQRAIGVARCGSQHIRLNALWCILAAEAGQGSELWYQMTDEIVVHELCHLIAWNFSQDRGHDSGWRMAMKLMGKKPAQYADFSAFPSWAEGYKAVAAGKLSELMGKGNVEFVETEFNPMDEV